MFTAALLAGAGMLSFGCLTGAQARKSINWDIFVTIGAAFGVSIAMENTGVANGIASALVAIGEAAGGQVPIMLAIYIATALLSNIIANNAAAAIMFPISFQASSSSCCQSALCCCLPFLVGFASLRQILCLPQVADELGIDYNLMSATLMLGASSCYMTPFGYQTNLMVFAAGGYRTMDFIRFGGPLQLWLIVIVTIILISHAGGYLWILEIASGVAAILIIGFPFAMQFMTRRRSNLDSRHANMA